MLYLKAITLISIFYLLTGCISPTLQSARIKQGWNMSIGGNIYKHGTWEVKDTNSNEWVKDTVYNNIPNETDGFGYINFSRSIFQSFEISSSLIPTLSVIGGNINLKKNFINSDSLSGINMAIFGGGGLLSTVYSTKSSGWIGFSISYLSLYKWGNIEYITNPQINYQDEILLKDSAPAGSGKRIFIANNIGIIATKYRVGLKLGLMYSYLLSYKYRTILIYSQPARRETKLSPWSFDVGLVYDL